MDDRAAIASWRLWMRISHSAAGGVTPRDHGGFAETEAGGVLLAEPAGVVLVGEDGRRRVLAADVPRALAVIAACGAVPLEDVLDGAAPGEPEEGLVAWLASTFGVSLPPTA